MSNHPSRFPPAVSILMGILAVTGFTLSLTHSVAALRVYAFVYIACFVAWLYVISKAGS